MLDSPWRQTPPLRAPAGEDRLEGGVSPSVIAEMNERSREIFRQVVEGYMASGEPIGSRTLARRLGSNLSPATIRNVMADLEELGLLTSPHTSAGRLPTDMGLRLFVDGLLEIGRLSDEERKEIDGQCVAVGRSMAEMLDSATAALSGLSRCAGLVMAPKSDSPLKHIEFVNLGPGRALVVMVSENGDVENRLIDLPPGMPVNSLVEASNYLAARLVGRTLAEASADILAEIGEKRAQLDALASRLVEDGLAVRTEETGLGSLIVHGRHNLLDDVTAVDDLERIRQIFEILERKESMLRLLEAANSGEGVRIFIGTESDLFQHAGCSMVIAPYKNSREKIVGAIGVIGPTRINYARIIPMVDYTAKVIGRLIG
jgi:heat-inducible transcriptional repressor